MHDAQGCRKTRKDTAQTTDTRVVKPLLRPEGGLSPLPRRAR